MAVIKNILQLDNPMLFFILTTVLTLVVIWFYWKIRKLREEAYKLGNTGLRPIPILGHIWIPIIYGLTDCVNIVIEDIKASVARSISSGVAWVGPYPLFLIAGPEDVQTVLNSPKSMEGGVEHNFFKYAFGNGLITAPVQTWKISRRHLNPVYHPRNLEFQMPVLNASAREMILGLSKHVGKGPVDVAKPVFSATIKSICKLLFGHELEIDIHSENFEDLMSAIDGVSSLGAKRLFQVWLWPEILFQFFCGKDTHAIMTKFKKFIDGPLKMKKEQRKYYHSQGTEIKSGIEKGESKLLSVVDAHYDLQRLNPDFTEKELQDEIITALMAGSESTKATILSSLLALAANPKIQETLFSEIVSVLGASDKDVTLEDLKVMPYLDQVVKETLRFFLVVPMVSRRVQDDLKLSTFTLPAGSTVIVLLLGLHFTSKYYPEPHKFNPDHFAPEEVARREKHTLMPFSGGPRSCIGKTYSFMAIKTLLVHIVRRYKLTTDANIEGLKFHGGLVLTSLEGYKVSLEDRQQCEQIDFQH